MIGFYSFAFDLAEYFVKEMKELGIPMERAGCLCYMPYSKIKELPDIVVAHPHDEEECCKTLKGIIQSSPNKEFYVFVIGKSEREKTIGNYKNLKYIRFNAFEKLIDEIIEKGRK